MPEKVLQVIRLGNPQWLLTDQAEKFFDRAFKQGSLVDGDNVRAGLKLELDNQGTGVFLGFVDGEVEGILIGFLPRSLFYPDAATLYHLYSNGGAKLRDKLITEFVIWITEHDYNIIHTANLGKPSDKGDKAWERVFRRWGNAVKMGSVYEIRLGE